MPDGFWQNRKTFVTGATGVVGSWLVRELLGAGARVSCLVRDSDPQSEFFRSADYRRTTIVQGSLEDYWTLERAISSYEPETVIHLAAQPIVSVAYRSPLHTFESNIRGTYNLLEAARVHADLVGRVVVASSDKAYGEQEALPYTEAMPLEGRQPYEVSKSCADLLSQSYFHTYGLPVAIARCGNIFGGGDLNWNRIVPETILHCFRESRPVVRSDGQYVRDYIYVKDAVRAYMRVAECLDSPQVRGEAFNFSPGRPTTVLEVVAAVQAQMGCSDLTPDIRNTAVGEIRSQYLDSSKAQSLLQWNPGYSLEEGLAETVAWYLEFLNTQDILPI